MACSILFRRPKTESRKPPQIHKLDVGKAHCRLPVRQAGVHKYGRGGAPPLEINSRLWKLMDTAVESGVWQSGYVFGILTILAWEWGSRQQISMISLQQHLKLVVDNADSKWYTKLPRSRGGGKKSGSKPKSERSF